MYRKYIKRLLDIVLSFIAIIILLPIYAIISILVLIFMGWPILFKQQRPGKNEKIFNMYKFRTMTNKKDENGNLLPDKERLNKFGKFLRSTSLDELPELFCILTGKMSFIGPRPLLVKYLQYYTEEESHRHDVRPGLTGWAQVNGRNLVNWEERFKYDIEYVKNISFIMDIKVILKTIKVVFKSEGISLQAIDDLDVARKKKMNNKIDCTIIQKLGENQYIKREDLIPISFGGNKARKSIYFFNEIEKNNYNAVVTYGSSSSNHCRIVANICASKNIPCYIISPLEGLEETFNNKMMKLFGANITTIPTNMVKETIEQQLSYLKDKGYNPYFIQGGGHGNLGTQAYVDCYNEIKKYEEENNINFDYIFFASGTGTTHSGLVCGNYLNKDSKKIVGISIARKNPRGKQIVLESICEYLDSQNVEYQKEDIDKIIIFDDSYICEGYGTYNKEIDNTIKKVLIEYGIPLDSTYTGKAFYGMQKYIEKNNIKNKNILFIHTGGTPLFFNNLERM